MSLDRDHLIELLEQLGDPDDGTALSAARDAHTMVAAGGSPWEELITGDRAVEEPARSEIVEAAVAPAGRGSGADEALGIIARLLARPELYQDTRDELLGYRREIEAGEFDEAETRYLRALDSRLSH